MRALITGAGGFVGHHVLEHFLSVTDWEIVATDSFRHKGKTDRIAQVLDGHPAWRGRVTIITHDLAAPFTWATADRIRCDYVIAMASESHVDRSIADPVAFTRNNVDVMLNTLELCRIMSPAAVLVMSTDEVYGPVRPGYAHKEWAPMLPSNPYAASKAAQEAIAISYWRAYTLPVMIVNCMNLYGERQDAEKYVPMVIRRVSRGQAVRVHGSPGNIGSRHYLHARNLADALHFLLTRVAPARFPAYSRPDRFNVAGPEAVSNLDLAQRIARITGCPLTYELEDFHVARPGHDPHYGLDPAKLAGLGWSPPVDFDESLERTVLWSLKHPAWLEGE